MVCDARARMVGSCLPGLSPDILTATIEQGTPRWSLTCYDPSIMSPFRMPAIPQRRVPLWLLGTLLICFLYFLPRPGEWNQDARLDMSLAIVNHATVQIDQYHWNAGVDAAQFEGHYYQNKAPGQSLLAVPVLAAYKGMLVLAGQGSQA